MVLINMKNNPLHISLFPAVDQERDELEYNMMLNSTLDIFESRSASSGPLSVDFGLLHALDDRIALYGWLLNTGIKLVIVVDMLGRTAPNAEAARTAVLGLRTSDLLPVCTFPIYSDYYVSTADQIRLSRLFKQHISSY